MNSTDDFLKQQIDIAAETAAARLPVRICGRSGSGLSETARAVHARIPGQDHCVEVDCTIAQDSPLEFALRGQWIDGDGSAPGPVSGSLLDTPGNVTLILDGIEALGSRAQVVAKRLFAQLDRMSRDHSDRGVWALVVTERINVRKQCLPDVDAQVFEDFWGHSFCVPHLSDRMDLKAVASTMLAEFAPDATLEDDAIHLMRRLGEHLTFYSMRRLLFQLSRRDRTGLITAARLQDMLPQLAVAAEICPACRGHPAREANCLRIRKTVRECDGNVSIAARRLGVSRNTIYKHAGQAQ